MISRISANVGTSRAAIRIAPSGVGAASAAVGMGPAGRWQSRRPLVSQLRCRPACWIECWSIYFLPGRCLAVSERCERPARIGLSPRVEGCT